MAYPQVPGGVEPIAEGTAPFLPLLITGVSGVTGYNALPYFQRRYPGQVMGIRPRATWRLSGPNLVGLDLDDASALRSFVARHRFRAVLDCAGNCALKACELDPEMAYRINVVGTKNLLDALEDSDTRLLHLSCDLVFSGARAGNYREEDPPDPVTVYGKTMALAEELILTRRPDALVLRISLPMGPSFNGHAGAIDWIASRFKKNRPATLYFDEVRTPTYTVDMNHAFDLLLRSRLTGLFHFGGPTRLTLYQIAQIVNRVGGFAPELLHGCPRSAAGPMPPRAGNVTLDSSRLRQAIGCELFRPWPLDSRLLPTHRQWHRDRSDSVSGSLASLERFLYRPQLQDDVASIGSVASSSP